MRVVVGISGASGAPIAVALLKNLKAETHLVVSKDAETVLEHETGLSVKDVASLAAAWYRDDDFRAPIASGSFLFDAMAIVPCSMSTVAKVSAGVADTLLTRTAAVAVKERRKLIVVPRETPLSEIHLENMLRLTRLGVVVLPAMPAWYTGAKTADDQANYMAGKVLDHLGLPHALFRRWSESGATHG